MASSSEMPAAPTEVEVKPVSEEGEGEQQSQDAPIQFNPGINVPVPGKKKKRGKKSAASRGPTGMAKNRGSGFEGRVTYLGLYDILLIIARVLR